MKKLLIYIVLILSMFILFHTSMTYAEGIVSRENSQKTGWQLIDGVWYYFQPDGSMKIGWLEYNRKKYSH